MQGCALHCRNFLRFSQGVLFSFKFDVTIPFHVVRSSVYFLPPSPRPSVDSAGAFISSQGLFFPYSPLFKPGWNLSFLRAHRSLPPQPSTSLHAHSSPPPQDRTPVGVFVTHRVCFVLRTPEASSFRPVLGPHFSL